MVCDRARIGGNALVADYAVIKGSSRIGGDSRVFCDTVIDMTIIETVV